MEDVWRLKPDCMILSLVILYGGYCWICDGDSNNNIEHMATCEECNRIIADDNRDKVPTAPTMAENNSSPVVDANSTVISTATTIIVEVEYIICLLAVFSNSTSVASRRSSSNNVCNIAKPIGDTLGSPSVITE